MTISEAMLKFFVVEILLQLLREVKFVKSSKIYGIDFGCDDNFYARAEELRQNYVK